MTKDEIKDLVILFSKENISKIKIKNEKGFEIELRKNDPCCAPATTTIAPSPAPINVNVVSEGSIKNKASSLNSPMVGTFYKAPAPGANAFVKKGQVVKKGSTVAIIEAMKIMNEIEADYDLKILEVLVEDGQPVEYDMPLFEVEKI